MPLDLTESPSNLMKSSMWLKKITGIKTNKTWSVSIGKMKKFGVLFQSGLCLRRFSGRLYLAHSGVSHIFCLPLFFVERLVEIPESEFSFGDKCIKCESIVTETWLWITAGSSSVLRSGLFLVVSDTWLQHLHLHFNLKAVMRIHAVHFELQNRQII